MRYRMRLRIGKHEWLNVCLSFSPIFLLDIYIYTRYGVGVWFEKLQKQPAQTGDHLVIRLAYTIHILLGIDSFLPQLSVAYQPNSFNQNSLEVCQTIHRDLVLCWDVPFLSRRLQTPSPRSGPGPQIRKSAFQLTHRFIVRALCMPGLLVFSRIARPSPSSCKHYRQWAKTSRAWSVC